MATGGAAGGETATQRNIRELRANVLAGSVCTALCVALWNPLDTLRIKWQVAQLSPESGTRASTMRGFAREIVRKEGLVNGLWRPGCIAHSSAVAISSGFRLGFYPTLRDLLAGDEGKNAFHMWASGFLSGAVGFVLANPFFQAKVRLQTTSSWAAPPYRRMSQCLSTIYREEGVSGLYRGSTSLLVRGALLSSGAQLGYDYTKTEAKRLQILEDGPVLHVIASVASAFLASVMSAPCDVVMTRYQAAPVLGIKYLGLSDCARQIIKQEGLLGLYRGWTPLFARLAPLWMINMPMYEATRRLMGLSYLD